MVITGQMLNLDSMFRYRTNAINVETAVRASVTRLDVRSDNATRRMFAAIARQQNTVKAAKYGVSADVTPQTAGTFLDRGIMFASRGEFEMAIADFDEAIRINPNMSAAYALRARALFASVSLVTNIGDNFSGLNTLSSEGEVSAEQVLIFDRAIADFSQAIRLDPNNATIYNERGNAYDSKGDFDRAITDYTQAIRLSPNYAIAYSNRGYRYFSKGEYDQAFADAIQAIRLDPSYSGSYDLRGMVYVKKRDYDRAIADFNEAIRLDSNASTVYYRRGEVYRDRGGFPLGKGDFDRAVADFNEAIRLKPYSSVYYSGRGLAYLFIGDYNRAIADFNEAIRLDPHSTDYSARGLAYLSMSDYGRAIADFEVALRLDPNNSDIRQYLNMARQQRGW
jgi:tetratricopeptide (TPR) repeat protein